MDQDKKDFIVKVTIEVMQRYHNTAAIQQVEQVDIAVEDFPGVARVLTQFDAAVKAIRKLGKVV